MNWDLVKCLIEVVDLGLFSVGCNWLGLFLVIIVWWIDELENEVGFVFLECGVCGVYLIVKG